MGILLWVAGATASGKDTLIDEVLSPLWFVSLKTSSMLRRAIPLFYPEIREDVNLISPIRLNELGTGIRAVHGQDFFAQLVIHEEIEWSRKVINGIRRWEEFDAVHQNDGLVILVASSVKEALRRVIEVRQRSIDKSISRTILEEHIAREKEELDQLSPRADLVLVNNFKTKTRFINFSRWKMQAFFEQRGYLL